MIRIKHCVTCLDLGGVTQSGPPSARQLKEICVTLQDPDGVTHFSRCDRHAAADKCVTIRAQAPAIPNDSAIDSRRQGWEAAWDTRVICSSYRSDEGSSRENSDSGRIFAYKKSEFLPGVPGVVRPCECSVSLASVGIDSVKNATRSKTPAPVSRGLSSPQLLKL